MSSNEAVSFRTREYCPGDFSTLCLLDQMCFPEGIAYTPEEIALGLAQPGAFVLVAEVENQVVAFLLAYQKKRPVGHIVTIDVHPDFRQRGIGYQLMELAEQRLRQGGAMRIVLEVSVENDPALQFYAKLGYLTRRLLPHYYRDASDAYLMEKMLP